MTVAFDVDEVLAEYHEALSDWHADRHGTPLSEAALTAAPHEHLGLDPEQWYGRLNDFMSERLDGLAPVEGSVDGVARVTHRSRLIAVTRRPEWHAETTREWLAEHYGDVFDAVECTTHRNEDGGVWKRCKGTVCLEHGAEVLVDDTPSHVERAVENQVKGVVFDRTDRDVYVPGALTVTSWEELSAALRPPF